MVTAGSQPAVKSSQVKSSPARTTASKPSQGRPTHTQKKTPHLQVLHGLLRLLRRLQLHFLRFLGAGSDLRQRALQVLRLFHVLPLRALPRRLARRTKGGQRRRCGFVGACREAEGREKGSCGAQTTCSSTHLLGFPPKEIVRNHHRLELAPLGGQRRLEGLQRLFAEQRELLHVQHVQRGVDEALQLLHLRTHERREV